MKIITVASPATDAGKTFLAAGIAEAAAYHGLKTAFADFDIAVGDALRVFGLSEMARKPHPTIASWPDYSENIKETLKTKTGVYVYPKPENYLEVITETDVQRFIQYLDGYFDILIVDMGTDHRLSHWDLLNSLASTALLVVDCDQKGLVRVKNFIRNSLSYPPSGWIVSINSREQNPYYSTKEIARLFKSLPSINTVIQIPYFPGIEKKAIKTFQPDCKFAKIFLQGLLNNELDSFEIPDDISPEPEVLEHNNNKNLTPKTKSLFNLKLKSSIKLISNHLQKKHIANNITDASREDTVLISNKPDIRNKVCTEAPIGVMINGNISRFRNLEDAKLTLAEGNCDVVFLQSEMTEIIEIVKRLRRLVNCLIVIIGDCNSDVIKAGADECFPELSAEIIKIIQAKAEKIKLLWQKANFDDLTGCYQRNFVDNCFNQAIENFKEKEEPFSVLTFDLNDFKQINDTYGHNAGDEVLRLFGQHLRTHSRKFDFPIRSGGDEFLMLISNATSKEAAEIAIRIKESWLNNLEFPVTFSIGLAQVGKDGTTQEEILAVADKRMYQDKLQNKHATSIVTKAVHHTKVEVRKSRQKTNILALVANASEEKLAAFSIYMANAVANNGMGVTLVDCYYEKPLIGPMLKLAKTKDWRKRGINATALINKMKVLPLSQTIEKDQNYLIEDKLKDLIQELQMIDQEGLIIMNFGKGSPLLDVIKDLAVVVSFKISNNNYQYQLPQMANWDNIPGEPDYARDLAIMEMVNKLRGVNIN